jgi:hypothetical protein
MKQQSSSSISIVLPEEVALHEDRIKARESTRRLPDIERTFMMSNV